MPCVECILNSKQTLCACQAGWLKATAPAGALTLARGARVQLRWEKENVGDYLVIEIVRRGGGEWSKVANEDMRSYGDDVNYRTATLRNERIKTGLTLKAAQRLCQEDDLCVGVVHRRTDNTWHFKTRWKDSALRIDYNIDSYRRNDAVERVLSTRVQAKQDSYTFSIPQTDSQGHRYQGDIYVRAWAASKPTATMRFPVDVNAYFSVKGDRQCEQHDDCPGTDYCDKSFFCYPWYGCTRTGTYNDPVDGTCPTKAKFQSATIEASAPVVDQEYSSADSIVLKWDFNPAAGPKINAWLVRAHRAECLTNGGTVQDCGKVSDVIVADVFKSLPTDQRHFEFAPDITTPTGRYYIGFSKSSSSSYISAAPFDVFENRVRIGMLTFVIERYKCPSHNACAEGYCQSTGLCGSCAACRDRQNGLDGLCPLRCLQNLGPPFGGQVLASANKEFFHVLDVTHEGCRSYKGLTTKVSVSVARPTLSATISGYGWGGLAARAIDGSTGNGKYSSGSCAHSNNANGDNWLRIGLGRRYEVTTIKIFGRADCCQYQGMGLSVHVGGTGTKQDPLCAANVDIATNAVMGKWTEVVCQDNQTLLGSIVSIHATNYMVICEVDVDVAPPATGSQEALIFAAATSASNPRLMEPALSRHLDSLSQLVEVWGLGPIEVLAAWTEPESDP